MNHEILLSLTLILPLLGAGLVRIFRSGRGVLNLILAGVLADAVCAAAVSVRLFATGPLTAFHGWLYLDALSAYHLLVMALVFVMSSLYGRRYFDEEIQAGLFSLDTAHRYGSLWFASLATMTLVLVSNNIGMMWVGMEATTLVTAFLICVHKKKDAIEAMWKYLIVCSVGIAFAFLGTILVAAATAELPGGMADTLFWTRLHTMAASLNPTLMKAGFLFALVGYGTKAGLAPMHTWLPDAHSQAPAPVSAIFSGFMLNAALYCIMRQMSLVDTVLGDSRFTSDLVLLFGIVSITVAAAFILRQHDLKRLLAYSTVEHLGIITLGLGLGRPGIFAALFHILNHSVCKSLGFFSAGSLGKVYGTYDMGRMTGAVHQTPTWGRGLVGSLMALTGIAPFPIFLSELLIVKSALQTDALIPLVFFLFGSAAVFVGALQHLIPIAWGKGDAGKATPAEAGPAENLLVFASLGLLLVLGVWMPEGLQRVLDQAARIVGGLG